LLFFRVHADAVEGDRLHDLAPHDFGAAVRRQLKVEEARVRFGQHLVHRLVSFHLGLLDHEAHILRLEVLVVGRDAFLAPAELNELLFLLLSKGIEGLPEHEDNWVLAGVAATVASVAHEKVNIDRVPATYPNLKFLGSHNVEKRARNNLANAALDTLELRLRLSQSVL
jgi:hypothetical protein